jgi:hypothetical protein
MFVHWASAIAALAALLVLAAAFGFIGLRSRRMRTILVLVGPLYSVAILVYFLIEGAGSECSGAGASFHCWEVSYASTWGVYGTVLVGAVVVFSLAPIVSAWLRSRRPAAVAAVALAVVIGMHVLGLWPWVPAVAAVLAAAIAGPPSGEPRATRPSDLPA